MSQYDEDHLQKIMQNFQKFSTFCSALGDRSAPVAAMLEHLGDRLVTCPASSREEYHNAWPGGLVDHSLRVLTLAAKIAKAAEVELPKESLIISALFHDLGKVGDLSNDYYIPEENDWKRKNGKPYAANPKVQYMTSAHRGLYLLQHFGVKLTEDEFIAILLNDGPEADENKIYSMKEPTLAVVIHQADRMACEVEKLQAKKAKVSS